MAFLFVCRRELRLAALAAIEETNRFLEETCLPRIHATFSPPALDSADAHLPLEKAGLREPLFYEYRRELPAPVYGWL